jgi:hypothetical protein
MALLSGAEDALAKDVEFQCDVRLALSECMLTRMDLPPDPDEEARLPERRTSWVGRQCLTAEFCIRLRAFFAAGLRGFFR